MRLATQGPLLSASRFFSYVFGLLRDMGCREQPGRAQGLGEAMALREFAARLFGSVPKVLRAVGLSRADMAKQPGFDLYTIVDGVYVGGIHMFKDTSWEMHPDGDEALTLISGEIDVHLNDGGAQTVVTLKAGESCVVKKGVWHKQVVKAPGRLLFHTHGNTTQHRKTLA